MGDELWSGQAQNGVNSEFEVKFDLEDQGRLPPKTIGTLTKVFCIFGLNLAILAWMGPKLCRGQASDCHTDWHTHTDTHTDAGDDNTRRPKLASGKNGWWAHQDEKGVLDYRTCGERTFSMTATNLAPVKFVLKQQGQGPNGGKDYQDHRKSVRV